MIDYRVILEIEIEAKTPQEAARIAVELLAEQPPEVWTYQVQRRVGGPVVYVELPSAQEHEGWT